MTATECFERIGNDHIGVGSLVETYIHIGRERPLTARETADRDALRAWSSRRSALVVRVIREPLTRAEWLDAALAELGPAPWPAVTPERPRRAEVPR